MPKALELRKVIKLLAKFGIIYVTGSGRHPKFYEPQTRKSYPIKSHGKKTMILWGAHYEKTLDGEGLHGSPPGHPLSPVALGRALGKTGLLDVRHRTR